MTIYVWSTLSDGQTIAFNPAVDVLRFDDASISAADLSFSTTGTTTRFSLSGKDVTLQAHVKTLTSTNVVFADGSVLLAGDNTIATANDDGPNTVVGGSGNDRIWGLGGDDLMSGGAGDDFLSLLGGGPTFFPWGNDTADGGAGYDTLGYPTSTTAAASVNLATHLATSTGGTTSLVSIEAVYGTAGNDTFVGGDPAHGIDALGNTTTERFRGNAGNDTITGAAGLDFVTVADYAGNSASQAANVNLGTGVATDGLGGSDTLVNVDGARGGAGNDTLLGGSSSRSVNGQFYEVFRGNAGNDTIDGAGTDTIIGAAGSDRADYASSPAGIVVSLLTGLASDGFGGTDTLRNVDQIRGSNHDDTLTGGNADDTFDGGPGNDRIDGGLGRDEARYETSAVGVIVNLGASAVTVAGRTVGPGSAYDGQGGTDTLIGIEQARGSDYDDYLIGGAGDEILTGGAGNDVLEGGAGIDIAGYYNTPIAFGGLVAFLANANGTIQDPFGGLDTLTGIEGIGGTNSGDRLTGGAGDQWFRGRAGSDTIDGGAGSDWASYSSDKAGVTVDLAAGIATDGWGGIWGMGGTDTLASIENAEGSDFGDTLSGTAGRNTFIGRLGNDTINGRGDIDALVINASRAAATITQTGPASYTVSSSDGVDTVADVERVIFADRKIALDLAAGQSAGNTTRILGAALGPSSISAHPEYVGIGITLFDGGWTLEQVCTLAVSAMGSPSNVDFVNTVYANVVGAPPTDPVRDFYVGLLQGSGGTMTQGQLLALGAMTDANAGRIIAAGVLQPGVEYI